MVAASRHLKDSHGPPSLLVVIPLVGGLLASVSGPAAARLDGDDLPDLILATADGDDDRRCLNDGDDTFTCADVSDRLLR